MVNLAFPPQLGHPDLELWPQYYRQAIHHRTALPRRGCGSLLPYISLYEFAAKGFDRLRRANLCWISPVRRDTRHLSPATLLAEAPRGEKFRAYTDLPGSPRTYHRTLWSDAVTATAAPAVRPLLPYHLLISLQSKLRPCSVATDCYSYRI